MNLKTLSALCLAASTLATASTAMAWESGDGVHSTSASVELASDYVWRGVSQTKNKPAISGSFDYAHSTGLYVGTWASNVDFDDDAQIEIDIYGGFAGAFGDSGVGYDLGVQRYIFPGESALDFNEVYGSLSFSFFTLGVAHSGDVFGTSERGTYYSLGFDYDLPMGFALTASAGYYDFDSKVFGPGEEDSYSDYLIGVTKDFAGFDFGLTWTTSDSDGKDLFGSRFADSRFILSISNSF